MLLRERVVPLHDRRLRGAQDRRLERPVGRQIHAQIFRAVAGGLAHQADPQVLPQRLLAAESPRRVDVDVERRGPNPRDAGQVGEADDHFLPLAEPHQLLAQARLALYRLVVAVQEQLEAQTRRRQLQPFRQLRQQFGALGLVLEGDLADHDAPALERSDQLVGLRHPVAHAFVVGADQLLEHVAAHVITVMHRLEEPAGQQVGELAGVDRIALVSALGDPRVLARVAHGDLLGVGLEVAVEPRRQRPFLERQVARLADRTDHLPQGGDGRRHAPLASRRVGPRLHAEVGGVAVGVHGDIMLNTHRESPSEFGVLRSHILEEYLEVRGDAPCFLHLHGSRYAETCACQQPKNTGFGVPRPVAPDRISDST